MSVAALPFATFLLLLEFAAGTQLVLLVPQFRGQVSPGFLKMGALMAFAVGCLALWAAAALSIGGDVAGYPLDGRFGGPMRVAATVYVVLSAVTAWLIWRERLGPGRTANLAATAAGLATILLAAAVVRLPTWGYLGAVLSLLAGAASLGAVSLGMTLGHWYLVTPRLPERPLNDLTLLLLVLLAAQTLLVGANVIIPAGTLPAGADALETNLGANLWFWLRVGVGLLFPLALAFMAWQSSVVRAMMSATGLLYIAMGAVLAGEVLARALLFSTARPL